MNEWGAAVSIEECRQDLTDHNALPSWLRLVALMGAILLMLLPPVAIFRAMGMVPVGHRDLHVRARHGLAGEIRRPRRMGPEHG